MKNQTKKQLTAEAQRHREKLCFVNSAAGAINKVKLCVSAPLR